MDPLESEGLGKPIQSEPPQANELELQPFRPAQPDSTAVVVWHRAGTSLAVLRACVERLIERAGEAPFDLVVCNLDPRADVSAALATVGARTPFAVLDADAPDVAAALNKAFAAYPNSDIVRVRSDVVVETQGWLDRLRALASQRPKVAAFGARMVAVDGRIRSLGRQHLGGLGVLPRAANLRQYEPDPYSSASTKLVEPIEVDSVSGAFAWYRRAAIDVVGGLDPAYRLELGEDDDFCMSVRRVGFGVLVDPVVAVLDLSPSWSPSSYKGDSEFRSTLAKTMIVESALWRTHAQHWRAKWGYDPRYPDLDEVRRLYGDTEICWRIGSKMAWQPSSSHPAVDIAIVTWNNAELLERCLRSLAETQYAGAIQVHVTDNGSADDTLAVLAAAREWLPFPLHVHDLVVNTGVTVGFNWSIVRGEAELVARLDDDVVVPPDWLETLVETMHRRPHAGCVGPKVLNDNARRTIQCGPFRMFPGTFAHTDEEDQGQADFVARCSHVRGCCNLYRRDVLDEVGLFDLRYAPSQWDDPDHHMALWAAGYEVVYDGRVGIVHALTTGKGRTWAAMSNQVSNKFKLIGKWSKECWQVVETSLDLSNLGRLLPDDETAFRRGVPAPASYPRQSAARGDTKEWDEARKLLRFDQLARDVDGPLSAHWRNVVGRSSSMLRDRSAGTAMALLHGVLDHTPTDTAALGLLVRAYVDLAMPEEASRYLAIAKLLDAETDRADLEDAVARCAEPRMSMDTGDLSADIGEVGAGVRARYDGDAGRPERPLRVLMANTFMPRTAGGDMMQIGKVADHLRAAGVEVDVRYRAHPSTEGYDIAHVYNLWFPAQTLPQVRGIRATDPSIPIAFTPIYWDMAEKNWVELAIPVIYSDKRRPQRAALLQGLADGSLVVDGVKRAEADASPFPGYQDYQARILETVDWILPQSESEAQLLRSTFGIDTPHSVVTNGAERRIFENPKAELFRDALGLAPDADFVLTTGLVEVRKNLLLLLEALSGTGVHVIAVGRNYDPEYLQHCKQVGGANVTFIEHLPHELLASAMKAARVFALPSWMECSAIASLEAAVVGCPIVVGNRTSEAETFGDAAYLCDPADVLSIRDAVLRAWRERDDPVTVARRMALQQRMLLECSWNNAAVQTLQAYATMLERRGQVLAAEKAHTALERARGSAAGLLPA